MTQQLIPSPFQSELNVNKVAIFFEPEPLTDKFELMMFTEDQMKKIQDFMRTLLPKCEDCGGFTITTDEEVAHTFPNVKHFYTQAEIDEAD